MWWCLSIAYYFYLNFLFRWWFFSPKFSKFENSIFFTVVHGVIIFNFVLDLKRFFFIFASIYDAPITGTFDTKRKMISNQQQNKYHQFYVDVVISLSTAYIVICVHKYKKLSKYFWFLGTEAYHYHSTIYSLLSPSPFFHHRQNIIAILLLLFLLLLSSLSFCCGMIIWTK